MEFFDDALQDRRIGICPNYVSLKDNVENGIPIVADQGRSSVLTHGRGRFY